MNACRAYVYAVAAACDRGETTRKIQQGVFYMLLKKRQKLLLRQSSAWVEMAI